MKITEKYNLKKFIALLLIGVGFIFSSCAKANCNTRTRNYAKNIFTKKYAEILSSFKNWRKNSIVASEKTEESSFLSVKDSKIDINSDNNKSSHWYDCFRCLIPSWNFSWFSSFNKPNKYHIEKAESQFLNFDDSLDNSIETPETSNQKPTHIRKQSSLGIFNVDVQSLSIQLYSPTDEDTIYITDKKGLIDLISNLLNVTCNENFIKKCQKAILNNKYFTNNRPINQHSLSELYKSYNRKFLSYSGSPGALYSTYFDNLSQYTSQTDVPKLDLSSALEKILTYNKNSLNDKSYSKPNFEFHKDLTLFINNIIVAIELKE